MNDQLQKWAEQQVERFAPEPLVLSWRQQRQFETGPMEYITGTPGNRYTIRREFGSKFNTFVLRLNGRFLDDFSKVSTAKAAGSAHAERQQALVAREALATGLEADVLGRLDRVSANLMTRTRENGDEGRSYDVNQQTWAAEIHMAIDLLTGVGYDRKALSEKYGFGRISKQGR